MGINGQQNKVHQISCSTKLVNVFKKESVANKALWVFLDDNHGKVIKLQDQQALL